jgi:hypothetical protein
MGVPVSSRDRQSPSTPSAKAPVGQAIDLVTILFALWLLSGVFIDGYAHSHIDETLETFFTPWHAVLYSGYLSSAAWLAWLLIRNYRLGWRGTDMIPAGYGTGVVGAILFAFGGVGDMIWHIIFGIEVGIEALYSPSHLFLFAGGTLIVLSPFKRAWHDRGARDGAATYASGAAPGFRQLLPALLSLAFAASFTAFFAMNFWAFGHDYASQHYNAWRLTVTFDRRLQDHLYDTSRVMGILNILVTNAILFIPLLWLLKRWQPPLGAFTVLWTVPLVFMTILSGFNGAYMIAVGAGTGIAADLLWRFLPPRLAYAKPYGLLAVLSAVMWGGYFWAIDLNGYLAWEPEFWGGAIVLAAMSSVALGKLSEAR